jgi:hypothetical protein
VIGLTDALSTKNELDFVNQALTPANPDAGELKIYSKTDNQMYQLTSAGVETVLGGGGGTPTYTWRFSNLLAGAPASSYYRTDNATPASVSEMLINNINSQFIDQSIILTTLQFGDQIYVCNAASTNCKLYTISSSINNGTYFTYSVALENENNVANYTDDEEITLQFFIQSPFNQSLNTTNTVEFSSVILPLKATEATPAASKIALYGKTGVNDNLFLMDENGINHQVINAQNNSTGVLTGGVLSVGTPTTTFSITDGSGLIVSDDPLGTGLISTTEVFWTGHTNVPVTNIGTQLITYIEIDISGNVVQTTLKPDTEARRDNIFLGVIVHVNNLVVNDVNNEQDFSSEPLSQFRDLTQSLGFLNLTGNTIGSSFSGDMTIIKTIGTMFAEGSNYAINPSNPNITTLAQKNTNTGDDFQYRLSDGTNTTPNSVDIDPNVYESPPGTLTAVAGNRYSIQRWYVSTTNNIKVQYGQDEYKTTDQALAGITEEPFITETSLAENTMLIGYSIVKQGTTDLDTAILAGEAIFVRAGKFGTVVATATSSPITNESSSTGVVSGGILSIGTGGAGVATTFSITSGTGDIVQSDALNSDVITRTPIEWTAFNDVAITNLLTQPQTYVAINISGAIIQSGSPFTNIDGRNLIILGVVGHSNLTTVLSVGNAQRYIVNPANSIADLAFALGSLNIEGNQLSGNASLTFNKAVGKLFAQYQNYSTNPKDPSIVDIAAIDTTTGTGLQSFRYGMLDGTQSASLSSIIPDKLDDGTPYPGASFSNTSKYGANRVFIVSTGLLFVAPPQFEYGSLTDAIDGINTEGFVINANVSIFNSSKFGASQATTATTDLQTAYNNSVQPQITTDAIRGSFDIKNGQSDAEEVLKIQNQAGDPIFSMTGLSDISIGNGDLTYTNNGVRSTLETGGTQSFQVSNTTNANGFIYDGANDILRPTLDGGLDLGGGSQRWGKVFGESLDISGVAAMGPSTVQGSLIVQDTAANNPVMTIKTTDSLVSEGTIAFTNSADTTGFQIAHDTNFTFLTQLSGTNPYIRLQAGALAIDIETTNNSFSPVSSNTVLLGTPTAAWKEVHCNEVVIGSSATLEVIGNELLISKANPSATLRLTADSDSLILDSTTSTLRGDTTNTYDLGTDAIRFKDAYLSGDMKVDGQYYEGTNSGLLVKNGLGGADGYVVGTNAGLNLSTATRAILIGSQAGILLTTGNQNLGIGHQTLSKITIGSQNTACGNLAIQFKEGSFNTAFGQGALTCSTGNTGNQNSAFGTESLGIAEDCFNSTAIGFRAGRNISGSDNSFVGNKCGEGVVAISSGSNNSGMGSSCLLALTTGSDNVCVGVSSGSIITTGSGNVLLGSGATVDDVDANSRVAIGQDAIALVNNEMRVGSTSAGTTVDFILPGITANTTLGNANFNFSNLYLSDTLYQESGGIQINGSAGAANNIISIGYESGTNAATNVSFGSASVSIGQGCGATNLGTNSVAIGAACSVNSTADGSIAIGSSAGNISGAITITGDDNIAIGTESGTLATASASSSIAIGNLAGSSATHNQSIIINASGVDLPSVGANTFNVKPIREVSTNTSPLKWDSTSGEITADTEVWTEPTPATNWGIPTGFQEINYKKQGDILFLDGLIERTGTGLTPTDVQLFTLPLGYRPAKETQFVGGMGGGATPGGFQEETIIVVKSNGQVTLTSVGFLNQNQYVRINAVVRL